MFPYGSIKSERRSNTGTDPGNFNSTMVRLKVLPTISGCLQRRLYFNSTMVRLKDYLAMLTDRYRRNFNSTMVRLKESNHRALVLCIKYFNSTMVRLKVILLLLIYPFEQNFNSTMVRLKDAHCIIFPEYIPSFQFHYGSIKRAVIIELAKTDR